MRMTEKDWVAALDVFRASSPRRGKDTAASSKPSASSNASRRRAKTRRNFASLVALTAGFILAKSVHTATA
jgi:hypothetical protein